MAKHIEQSPLLENQLARNEELLHEKSDLRRALRQSNIRRRKETALWKGGAGALGAALTLALAGLVSVAISDDAGATTDDIVSSIDAIHVIEERAHIDPRIDIATHIDSSIGTIIDRGISRRIAIAASAPSIITTGIGIATSGCATPIRIGAAAIDRASIHGGIHAAHDSRIIAIQPGIVAIRSEGQPAHSSTPGATSTRTARIA